MPEATVRQPPLRMFIEGYRHMGDAYDPSEFPTAGLAAPAADSPAPDPAGPAVLEEPVGGRAALIWRTVLVERSVKEHEFKDDATLEFERQVEVGAPLSCPAISYSHDLQGWDTAAGEWLTVRKLERTPPLIDAPPAEVKNNPPAEFNQPRG